MWAKQLRTAWSMRCTDHTPTRMGMEIDRRRRRLIGSPLPADWEVTDRDLGWRVSGGTTLKTGCHRGQQVSVSKRRTKLSGRHRQGPRATRMHSTLHQHGPDRRKHYGT